MAARLILGLVAVLPALLAGAAQAQTPPRNDVRPVAQFAPEELLGDWYELASLPPFFFQRRCASHIRLRISTSPAQRLALQRQCLGPDGEVEHNEARLRPRPDPEQPDWRRMQYSALALGGEFRFWLPRDYWVIERDPQQQWFVIGQENRRGASVLARQPQLPLGTLAEIIGRLKVQGYDACALNIVPQEGGLDSRSSLCEALNQGLAAHRR